MMMNLKFRHDTRRATAFKAQLISVLRGFAANQRGATAAMFAMILVILIGALGIAADAYQLFGARAALRTALDNALLAAGAGAATASADLSPLIQKYLAENLSGEDGIGVGSPSASYDAATNSLTASVEATVPTVFMGLVGVPEVDMTVTSTAARAQPGPVELVLALDTTASMNEEVGGVKKIVTLKAAAVNLVNTVMASPHAKVGVVPFSAGMNIGTEYKDKPWVYARPDYEGQSDCTTTGGSGHSCYDKTYSCMKDGFEGTCTQQICSWEVPPTTTCATIVRSWNGCVATRKNYENTIESPLSPKYPWTGNMCASKILDLSSSKGTVVTKINGLSGALDTYIPIGLTWAWNMLTPEEPLTAAQSKAELAAIGGKKVVVLMTDGMNSLHPSYNADGSVSLYTNTTSAYQIAVDNTLRTLCANVKNDGITLYTVAFAVPDESIKTILKGCASDTGKYYDAADSAGLNEAFVKIGKSLQALRIAR